MRLFLLVIAMSFVTGCAMRRAVEIPWRPGEVNPATGNMIAVRAIPGESPPGEAAETGLYAPYSMIIVWEGDGRFFYVFDNVKKQYFGTRRLDRFLAAVKSLPKGSSIETISSCQVSWDREMGPRRRERIEQAKRERKLNTEVKEEELWRLVCRCGSKGVQLPPVEREREPVIHPPVPWSDGF